LLRKQQKTLGGYFFGRTLYNSCAAAMKPTMTDFVSCDCDHLLCSFLSRITFIEVTINQWCDDTLTCCLSVNWNTSLKMNHRYIQWGGGESSSMRGQISHGVNQPGTGGEW